MKIVILGNGRAPYCSERDYEYTLKEMGHEVVFLQETEATGNNVLAASAEADALMWIHTWGWNTPGLHMKEVLKKLKELKVPTFTYHLDLMLDLGREKEIEVIGMNEIQHFFTVEGAFADYLNSQTQVQGHYLPAGVILRDCFIETPEPNFPYDVVFTGSYNYHPEWPYRPKLLDFLKRTYGARYHRWGHPGRDLGSSPYVMGTELNKIYSSAKVVVADTLCLDFKKEYYFSNRVFEQTGKGAFVIHPYIKGLEDCFELGKEIVTYPYDNFAELNMIIDHYISHPEEREAIRKAGHERTKRDHTFTNRLQEMLSVICKHENFSVGADKMYCQTCNKSFEYQEMCPNGHPFSACVGCFE
jgi:hypothetical protein